MSEIGELVLAKIEAKIAARKATEDIGSAHERAIYFGLCPDCAGPLVKNTSWARKHFSQYDDYRCLDCGALHSLFVDRT